MLNGERYVPISTVATAINRSPETLRRWERHGIFPRFQRRVYRSGIRSRRFYSMQQMKAIVKAAEIEGVMTRGRTPTQDFPALVFALLNGARTTGTRRRH